MNLNKVNLYKTTQPWTFAIKSLDINIEIAHDMLRFMRANEGIGLAANQVGMNRQLFVMEVERDNKTISTSMCFNPEIISFSDEKITLPEGCLSFPDQQVLVMRAKEIAVRYRTALGVIYETVLTGLEARVYQHEYDHLHGITMLKRQQQALDL